MMTTAGHILGLMMRGRRKRRRRSHPDFSKTGFDNVDEEEGGGGGGHTLYLQD